MGAPIQHYTDDSDGIRRILYNSSTGKILTSGIACDSCETFPDKIKMTLADVVLCCSPGECCYGTSIYKITRAPVDSLNGLLTLRQGFVKRPVGGTGGNTNFYVLERGNPGTCDLYAIQAGDFGEVDVFQSGGCIGFRAKYQFHQKVYQVRLIAAGETVNIYVYSMLGARFISGDPTYDVDWISGIGGVGGLYIFHWQELSPEVPYPNCLPYDALLPNTFDCADEENPWCMGNGTALLEVP